MNVQIGNREKIAGLVILCLASIILVHWFFIMGKAQQYRAAYDNWTAQKARWLQLVDPSAAAAIGNYEKDTQVMDDFLKDLTTDLNVQFDTARDYDETTTGLAKRRLPAFLDVVAQVCDLRKQQFKTVKLTFLDAKQDNSGWDIPRQLPLAPLAMWDQINRLKNTVQMLDVMEQSFERMARQQQYEQELASIGINIQNLIAMRDVAGELVPTIKKIAHARLIWEQRQRDNQTASVPVPIKTQAELDTLLKIKLPEDPLVIFHYTKQLHFLLRLIKLADDSQIEDISLVRLIPLRKIDEVTDENQIKRLASERHFDQLPPPPGGRGGYGVQPPGWRPGMPGGAPGAGAWGAPPGAGAWGARAAYAEPDYGDEEGGSAAMVRPGPTATPADPLNPTPTPQPTPNIGGAWMGNAVPIRMVFTAPYENALNFLYTVSHNRNPYALDRLQMTSQPQGKIQIDVTFAPMAWVTGTEGFYAPQGTTRTLSAMPLPPTPAATAGLPGALGGPRLGGAAGEPRD